MTPAPALPERGDRVGVVAGRGAYPMALCERLAAGGLEPVIACLEGQAEPSLFTSAACVETFPIGAFAAAARFLLGHGISEAYFAGGVERRTALRSFRPDLSALPLLPLALFGRDDDLLAAAARHFERLEVRIGDPRPFLGDLLAPDGLIAGPAPDTPAGRLIRIAVRAARRAAETGEGQAAIAFRGEAIMTEDRGGTDALLARAPGPGAVLAKVSGPNQDPRFDLPSIGPATIRIARAVGLAAIAVEAGRSLVLSRPRVAELCGACGIPLVGVVP
jgi:UDP-2,3-diacylglucosamine hydrolase